MSPAVVALVLLAAALHAGWNTLLRGGARRPRLRGPAGPGKLARRDGFGVMFVDEKLSAAGLACCLVIAAGAALIGHG